MNICTNYPQIEEEEEKEKPRAGCAAGVALLEKAKFRPKSGSSFLVDLSNCESARGGEIYTFATNCSISMDFLEIVERRHRPVQCKTANFQLN